jgi:hypothetical protein
MIEVLVYLLGWCITYRVRLWIIHKRWYFGYDPRHKESHDALEQVVSAVLWPIWWIVFPLGKLSEIVSAQVEKASSLVQVIQRDLDSALEPPKPKTPRGGFPRPSQEASPDPGDLPLSYND